MEKPSLDNDDEREAFLSELDNVVENKLYPACDASIGDDILVALFARDEAQKQGYSEFADAVDERIETILDVPKTVIDAAEEDGNPADEFSEDEVMSFLYSTGMWREATGSFTQRDNAIVHGGDMVNTVVNSDSLTEATDALNEFRGVFLTKSARSTAQLAEDGSVESPQASAKDVFLYNGVLMTVHRRVLGEPMTEDEMQVP